MSNKSFRLAILLLVFSAVVSVSAYGVIPQKINFQGRLTDDLGQPITGSRNMVFRIYDDPVSGAKLWEESQNNIAVNNGIFSVELGSFTPIAQSVFSSSNRYLEIVVQGSVLAPREQISAHAYSYVSETLSNNASVGMVNISTLTLNGSRTFLTGGEGAGAGVYYFERKNTGFPRDILELTFRLTGAGGAFYDALDFSGKKASFYKNTSNALVDMGSNQVSASSMTVSTVFYPPSGKTLPTGVNPGGLFYNANNFTMYLATETTTGTKSWVILGGAGHN